MFTATLILVILQGAKKETDDMALWCDVWCVGVVPVTMTACEYSSYQSPCANPKLCLIMPTEVLNLFERCTTGCLLFGVSVFTV